MTARPDARGIGPRRLPARRLLVQAWWPSFVVWLVMTLLLCVSLLCAFQPLGAWHFPLLVAIALVQSALVAWFFMQINRASALTRLTSASAFVFIAVLFAFTLADLFNRL